MGTPLLEAFEDEGGNFADAFEDEDGNFAEALAEAVFWFSKFDSKPSFIAL